MRFFLYTYAVPENWGITLRSGLFGTKKDATGLPTKVRRLCRGDLIIIRDGSKRALCFFGCCKVSGDVFDQDEYSPFRDYLWHDEIQDHRVIYPLRIPVDSKDVPSLSLDAVTWAALDKLKFLNAAGDSLQGEQAWGKKFVGNFVEKQNEVEAFCRLIGYTAA